MNIPIVLLIFNRSHTTRKVFETIRRAKPTHLLVVADGPRPGKPGEEEQCLAARNATQDVDWDCKLLTNFSESNLGCAKRVSTGLDWVFSLTDRAIILEDDCIVDNSYFAFAEELLEYYSNCPEVMSVCAKNVQFNRMQTEYSYYFSLYQHCWGWATWRRAWQHFDFDMELWPKAKEKNLLAGILEDSRAVKYWDNIFQETYEGKIDSWAYRWMFACWMQNGLSILPAQNMVSNIGFGADATHTKTTKQSSHYAAMTTHEATFPLRYPPKIVRNHKADRFEQNTLFNPSTLTRAKNKFLRTLG